MCNTSRSRNTERLAEAGIEPSAGSAGDSGACPRAGKAGPEDNALAETLSGLCKAAATHRRGPWRSFEAVKSATLEQAGWFNNPRLLEPIGNIPPAQAEAACYAQLAITGIAASASIKTTSENPGAVQ